MLTPPETTQETDSPIPPVDTTDNVCDESLSFSLATTQETLDFDIATPNNCHTEDTLDFDIATPNNCNTEETSINMYAYIHAYIYAYKSLIQKFNRRSSTKQHEWSSKYKVRSTLFASHQRLHNTTVLNTHATCKHNSCTQNHQ
eukprot:GHVR01001207.1.p1 GENE.GHVR01001207.1~~GHVR01001207.1.p1  ORF type:complete len:144 (+),score=15.49 GHVR01001207.1:358-789(+)